MHFEQEENSLKTEHFFAQKLIEGDSMLAIAGLEVAAHSLRQSI